ncbi:MAG: cobalt-precorrin-5B (C(1))-methyltransferase [Acidimicrobiales bacterium]
MTGPPDPMVGHNHPEDPTPYEPELSPEVAARRQGLRTGWTTGTCASAAAKAAVTALTTGAVPAEIEVAIPNGDRVSFNVQVDDAGRAVVVKDAGDDPDCTDGAHMTAGAEWRSAVGSPGQPELCAGEGIGTVTKPGLGLPVGAPAINPVPRRMIAAAVAEVTDRPVRITFSVPGGVAMAAKTTNDRLGIIGGISILGTTGVVKPFSTAAYRASVVQQIDVASAQGESLVVLATGYRSEHLALRLRPELDPVCVVEVGDFTGIALRRAARAAMSEVIFVGMAGKITKLAAGVMMTHYRRSVVDTDLMAEVARVHQAPAEVIAAATATTTARHFFETCMAHGAVKPLEDLCARARANCQAYVQGRLQVQVWMADFEGESVVARA